MRDGNYSRISTWEKSASPFRPSYEGWKLLAPRDTDQALHPFRPSYEGWKQYSQSTTSLNFSTFRPSYEGWKLLIQNSYLFRFVLLLDLCRATGQNDPVATRVIDPPLN